MKANNIPLRNITIVCCGLFVHCGDDLAPDLNWSNSSASRAC
jgi:hypothetical protein